MDSPDLLRHAESCFSTTLCYSDYRSVTSAPGLDATVAFQQAYDIREAISLAEEPA